MASSFKLVLDTTAPVFSGVFNGGFPETSEPGVELRLLLEGPDDIEPLSGYQFKIWGDVDPEANPDIQATEGESEWMSYGEVLEKIATVTLSSPDGAKTIEVKIRDDVWNESTTGEFSVELNTTVPVITITGGPTPGKISEVTGKNSSSFTFKANEDIVEWVTKVVPNAGSTVEEGTEIIGNEAGSEDLKGTELEGEKNQAVKVGGKDLHDATTEDGEFTVKVFGKNELGVWSI